MATAPVAPPSVRGGRPNPPLPFRSPLRGTLRPKLLHKHWLCHDGKNPIRFALVMACEKGPPGPPAEPAKPWPGSGAALDGFPQEVPYPEALAMVAKK